MGYVNASTQHLVPDHLNISWLTTLLMFEQIIYAVFKVGPSHGLAWVPFKV